jgi:hypothetical protein
MVIRLATLSKCQVSGAKHLDLRIGEDQLGSGKNPGRETVLD